MSTAQSQSGGGEYWPIRIARSDGQGWSNTEHRSLDPSDAQDAAQLERWEVIVGGHLQNQVGPKGDDRQYKLDGFPAGYQLRYAVRKETVRDYYLYGHPAGARASYRTPGEFALHALWLISDSLDNSQCPCDLCPKYVEREKLEREKARIAATDAAPGATHTKSPAPAPKQMQLQQQKQSQPQPQQHIQQQHVQLQQQQQQQPIGPPGTTGWTNVFRVGEMVWYKHTAWRLGVILAINPKPGMTILPSSTDLDYHFTLAPLGHALLGQTSLVKDCHAMRPFLTFSVPNTSLDELQNKDFDSVDWQAMNARFAQDPDPRSRDNSNQMLGLEASKMGARAINDAFSTFDLLAQGTSPDGKLRVQHYGGLYLGAEMVRVGDPIRVAASQQPDPAGNTTAPPPADPNVVMLISEIQVATSTTPHGFHTTLQFKGNLYRTVRSHTTHPLPQGSVPPETLPQPFAEELATRNRIERDKTMRWSWVVVAAQALRPEKDVQGRFYVTTRLMRVIDPARLTAWEQRGMLEEAPAYLNNRGHSGAGHYVGRVGGRRAMLGDKVAVEFQVPGGLVEN